MRFFKEYILTTIGSIITALGLNLFLIPNSIAAGGASGLGTVLHIVWGVPVSIVIPIINGILFILGFKHLGKSTIVKTLYSTLVLSLSLEVTSFLTPLTSELLLSAIYGGLLLGVGTGLTVANGGSTGGSDLAAIIIHKYVGRFTVARLILLLDLAVIVLSAIVLSDYEIMLYAAIALYTASITADAIIEGVNFSVLAFVITKKPEKVSAEIMDRIKRGITSLSGKGMYTKSELSVLLCAVRKTQFSKFKNVVRDTDENAFIILTDAREVFGNGFHINDK